MLKCFFFQDIDWCEIKIKGFVNKQAMKWKRYFRRKDQWNNEQLQNQVIDDMFDLRSLFSMEPFSSER